MHHKSKRAIVQSLLTFKVKYQDTMGEETKESSSLRSILMGTFLYEVSKETIRMIPGLQGLFGKETSGFPYKKLGMLHLS